MPGQDRSPPSEMSGVKFSPGSVFATPGVLAAFQASGDDPLAFLVTSSLAASVNRPSSSIKVSCFLNGVFPGTLDIDLENRQAVFLCQLA